MSGFPFLHRPLPWGLLLALFLILPSPSSGSDDDLKEEMESLLQDSCLKGARVAVQVVSLSDGRVLYDRNGKEPMVPASNVKIFTAAAALRVLGPGYRYPTTFHVEDSPAKGILRGPLYLKGWGAPDLVGETWWLITRELRRLGLETVEGDLVLDDSYFDAQHHLPGWPRPVVDRGYNAPVSALSCNFNVVTVRVIPADVAGDRPAIQLIPFRAHLQVRNQARTGRGASRISVVRVPGGGSGKILVKGSIRPGSRPIEVIRSVGDPALYAGFAFREVMETEGISIQGVRKGTTPEDSVEFYRYRSRPLSAILTDMNKYSNNFIAEMVLKTLSTEDGRIPGTTAGGLEVLRRTLLEQGVDLEGVRIRDGSGLSEGNLATAASLVSTLRIFGRDFELFPELLASLPISGIDGTLKDRNAAGAPTGRVRAKTGRLKGADTLSGFASAGGSGTRVFSILVNGSRCPHERVTAVLDRMADRIATCPVAPEPG